MSDSATVEIAQQSRRKSTRVKRDVIKYEEEPSKKAASGPVQKTNNSNGAASVSRKESSVSTRSGRVKNSAKDPGHGTNGTATVLPVGSKTQANSNVAKTTAAGKSEEKVAVDGKAERKVVARTKRASGRMAASATKENDLEAVATPTVQGKASGAIRKSNTSVVEKSKTSKQTASQKEDSQRSRGANIRNRKRPSHNSSSRKSRKDLAQSNRSSVRYQDSYSDESHSDSCSTCSNYGTSSDRSGSISCSCSDCEFEDRIRGKRRPAPKKKTPKIVKEYSGIYTPD